VHERRHGHHPQRVQPSQREPVHFLQIWILPEKEGLPPSYEERRFERERIAGGLCLLASREGRDGSLVIHQDAAVYATRLEPGQEAALRLAPGRHAWVQVARGGIECNGTPLAEGDGAALSAERQVALRARAPAEVLVFDLR
jgi:hypothetical protein